MSKTAKIWLITAASLVLIGCIIFGGVMSMLKWDFTKLSTSRYETNNYKITENYSNISIITDTADIVFVFSDDKQCSVECYERENAKHSVTVKDGTLVISVAESGKWYENIGINFGTPKITVYIPQGEYGTLSIKSSTGDVEIPKGLNFTSIDILENTGDVTCYASALEDIKIKTTTGDIFVKNVSSSSFDLSVSTGKVTVSDARCAGDFKVRVSTGKANLADISCKNFISSGNTGDILLKDVIACEKLSIKRSTGDVKFEGSDAAEIFVQTDTGNVTGTLLSEKVFIAKTDTGRVNLPSSVSGGRCEIITDTGDIKISIKQ